jgi:hypothetical protein
MFSYSLKDVNGEIIFKICTGRGYTLSVYYVDKLSSNDLLMRLKVKGMRNSDYTRAVIKVKSLVLYRFCKCSTFYLLKSEEEEEVTGLALFANLG